ncbi:DHA2 family efflux MFS transporter permease subunit [Microcella alkalica]|uniref:DHA2 family lincomycin resistance protein-like MFS transporter n=1 Tax=Microcella alkalica TaxID=355930 RepID=A0A839EDY0_9MICO|nr:DHA2 family lincomycin resistance protein-like MFS transporter [Microcella alkalica]
MTSSRSPETAGTPAPQPVEGPDQARNMLVIRLLLVSAFVVILNETLMGVAIPELMEDLRITASAAQWLTTAFMLTLAVVIPITGFLMLRFSTRRMFLAAMSLFTIGTAIATVAPGFEVLLIARIVQASGTAIMMPLLFTTVFALVPAHMRGRVVGNISIVISVAPALGPTVSGAILSIADWRWLFITMMPFAIGALALGAARIVNVGEQRPVRLDVLSVVLSIPGFGGLVYGLSLLGERGGGQFLPGLLALGVGIVAIGLFAWRQVVLQRTDGALLDLRTFASREFALAIAAVSIASMALFGAIILIPLYVQDVLGAEAVISGLLILPGGLLMAFAAPFIGRRYDRVGPRSLVIPGAIVLSASLWSMTMFAETTPLWLVAVGNLGTSLGLALLFTPLITNGMSSLTPQLSSYGSAIIGTVQQVSGAAGIALFISVSSAFAGPGGAATDSVTAEGVRAAFAVGAVIALVTIPLVLMVRRASAVAPTGHAAHSAASTAENSAGSTTLSGAPTKKGATSSGS